MKRSARFLAVLLLVLLMIPAAHADLIITPDNDFFEQHDYDCFLLSRAFYTNGPKGYVTVWEAPEGKSYIGQYENGVQLGAGWQYENWVSVLFVHENGKRSEGWACLDELALIYDHISFEKEYRDQITPYNGEFDPSVYRDNPPQITEPNTIHFYDYPGAPAPNGQYLSTGDWGRLSDFFNAVDSEKCPIISVFVDENGLTWGYIRFWMGHRESWFCLDDPFGENFPVREVPESEVISVGKKGEISDLPVATMEIPVVRKGDTQTLTPPAEPVPPGTASLAPWLLVGGVVIVTLPLLWKLRKKK